MYRFIRKTFAPVFVGLALCGLLAACGGPLPPPDRPAAPTGAADTCGGAPYAGLVGQDATTLERVYILRQVRVIRPDTAVTMDYRPERLNFEVGTDVPVAVRTPSALVSGTSRAA